MHDVHFTSEYACAGDPPGKGGEVGVIVRKVEVIDYEQRARGFRAARGERNGEGDFRAGRKRAFFALRYPGCQVGCFTGHEHGVFRKRRGKAVFDRLPACGEGKACAFDGDGAIARVGVGCGAVKREPFRTFIYGCGRAVRAGGGSFAGRRNGRIRSVRGGGRQGGCADIHKHVGRRIRPAGGKREDQ